MGATMCLFALVLLAPLVVATPTMKRAPNRAVRLPMVKRLNFTGPANILEVDQARARSLHAQAGEHGGITTPSATTSSVPAANQLLYYVVDIGIGTPQTTYSLIVDTGTSNTWVGASKAFQYTSSTLQGTGESVFLMDIPGGGSMNGQELKDNVFLTDDLEVTAQSFGVAQYFAGINLESGVDGVIGLGPADRTQGTLFPDTTQLIPTITDNLWAQGDLLEYLVALAFDPTETPGVFNGELTFGGVDQDRFLHGVLPFPITQTFPASEYFGVDVSMEYGSGTSAISLPHLTGVVDAGSTLLLIPDDFFQVYVSVIGAVPDPDTGLYRLSPGQYVRLQSLYFANSDGAILEFTGNAQIWPRQLNTIIGGNPEYAYLVVGSTGRNSGSGLDIIFGTAFLERFYTVLDTGNHLVGFGNTSSTFAVIN